MATVAWISAGRLWLCPDGGAPTQWESAYARQVRGAHASVARRHAWKSEGRGARFAAWGAPMPDELPAQVTPTTIEALTRGRSDGELLYLVQSPGVSALCARTGGTEPSELRLFHTGDAQLRQISAAPDRDRIAASVQHPAGPTNLATLTREGSHLTEITEGDSLDAAPRWVPGRSRLLYQSAGIGRDERGLFAARAPTAVCMLDFETGALETLAEDAERDLLAPAMDLAGGLWFVRRPFAGAKPAASPLDVLKDVLLAPLRLARAVLGWLDFFTVRFSGKPLISSGRPQGPSPDDKLLMLMGHVVDVEQARRDSLLAGDAVPALVPQSWELVHRASGRPEETVARGVLAFDLADDGRLCWTNGSAVFVRDLDGAVTTVGTGDQITAVALV